MTPRQISAFLFLAAKRRKGEAAEALAIHTMASRGEARALKSLQKELTNG